MGNVSGGKKVVLNEGWSLVRVKEGNSYKQKSGLE